MNGLTPCLAEVEQQRLFELNLLATRKRSALTDDGKCAYCGLRARIRNLCVICEDRRQRLSERYPGISPVTQAQEKIAAGPTHLGTIARAYRPPHNSE